MITRTALQLITDSLKLLGVVAGHEVPTSAEQQDSFARLNELIDSWGTHEDAMFVRARQVLPLVAGTQTYALTPSPSPFGLSAAATLHGTAESFVSVLTDQEYTIIPDKTLAGGQVTAVVFNNSTPLPELWVWPNPTGSQSLVLYFDEPVAQFPDLVTPVTLAPGYAKAIRTNLALELAPEFGRVVDPLVLSLARESLADVKRVNFPMTELSLSGVPGVCGGGYDITTDG